MLPLALETGGRHGRAALRHLRQLAAVVEEDRAEAVCSALCRRWGAELSVALHRATARQLRSSVGCREDAAALREEVAR